MLNPTLIINLGATVCERLKITYYPDVPWSKCWRQVAEKFTVLKERARRFYVAMSDETILKQLVKYKPEDIREMMND